MFQRYLLVLCFLIANIQWSLAEDCELVDNCRLVDINGKDDWINIPGHYRSIQECINDANSGDTCLVRAGRYHEELVITEKNNIAIRGDLDYDKPVIDGTIDLMPKSNYNNNNDGIIHGNWKEEFIGGKKVCVSELEVTDEKHPFQLFLKDDNEDEYEMMTNARWPNALWSDRDSDTGLPMVFFNEFWGKSDSTSDRGKMVDTEGEDGTSPLAASGLDMNGAMAILNVGGYNTFVKPVTSHNANDDFFTYDDDFGDISFHPERNQYYLDSSEALLDNPGEWYYDMTTNTLKFMPWSGTCPNPTSGAVRGRVIDYSIVITHTDGISISDLDFFASNIKAEATSNKVVEVNELYLDSLNFKYPSSSRRMLQDYNVPKKTDIVAKNLGTISIINCEFFGGEGTALHYWGKNAKIHNNMFKWNDWSGQMGLTKNGGFGTVYDEHTASDEEFVGNTLWYNGASAGFRPGKSATVKNNLVAGQCFGEIMHDGSGVQLQPESLPNSITEGNWILHSPKLGIRFDDADQGSSAGINGTIFKNLVWNTCGFMVKGDYNNVTGNLALDNYESVKWNSCKDEPTMQVIHMLREHTDVQNDNSYVENNAACLADGGQDQHTTEDKPWGRFPLAGHKSENYYGNNSWHGGDGYDGSWVLNGETVIPTTDLSDQLMDVNDYDFRPKPDSILVSTGAQIGPYAAAYSSNKQYNIAGRKEMKASFPIPHHNGDVKMKDALIFLPAFRCDDEGDKHLIYVAPKNSDFPPQDQPTAELFGEDNIIALDEIDVTINPGEMYKWRVDCIDGNKRRSGDVWIFTMHE